MFVIPKGQFVQVYKDAEHLTNPWRDHLEYVSTGRGYSTTRTAERAGWYSMTRPLAPKKALNLARAYQREGFPVRLVERTNSGTRVVKTLPQRRSRRA